MSNRLFSPNQQYADTTGLPYAGGSLTFYSSGTSTPLATYSNKALTVPNTNPVVLDSAGRAGDIFLQNLAYKVVLADVNSVPIWTADPVYASDFSTVASFMSGAGSPNGNTAGSQGSPTVPASVYWDTTNNILYVCTTTGNAAGAVWTAVNASTAAAIVPTPQGYLTLTTGTPVIPSDVIAGTAVYYTPYVGNIVPIYNGSSFVPTTFSELSMAMNAAHIANNIYDVFVFNNTGVPTLVTGPSWSAGTSGSIAAGSCARGTGAGGAALSHINGIWTNTVQITGRNGATTYTINANLATYVGSLFIDGTNGQVTCHRLWGQSRKWAVWNAYNRVPVILKAGDSTAAWGYLPNSIRVANGNTANSLTIFSGLPEEQYHLLYEMNYQATGITAGVVLQNGNGIGFNSVAAVSGRTAFAQFFADGGNVSSLQYRTEGIASYIVPPSLGVNVVSMLDQGSGNAASLSYQGTEAGHVLSASWRG